MILHLLLFSVILVLASSSVSVGANCNRVCKGSSRDIAVPFPFGFSDDCEVSIECTDTGQFRIGNYTVLNLTRDHIVINLPAKCDRPFGEIRRLIRNRNYALTSRNGLLLGNCSESLNNCSVSTRIIQGYFNLSTCGLANNSLNCYSDDNLGHEFINLLDLKAAGCRVLYSSITVVLEESSTQRSSLTMGFQSVELGWWVPGDCHCHHHAGCKNISYNNARVGYRCHCNNGYDGDGFVSGDGCRRVSNCNATKYISGECGGTRVLVLIGGIVVGASIMSIVAFICYCIRKRAILRNQLSAKRLISEASGSFNVPFYPYKEIHKATNGFSDKQWLGIGAYGTVYAGKLNNNEWVAIKKIRHIETYGIDQVMNEIKLLSSVSHPHLVRLLGFCIEKGEQILVYEFMPNGTLSQHLQKERGKGTLPWTTRLSIVTETAHAIAYLHSSMNPPIYHRDIKSSNILLDYNFRSKVADFGLSRVGITDESHISTAPQGTPGYVDPQYHQNFHLSDKSDVYSFGVVLVEIITALKVVDLSRRNTEVNLAALALNKISQGRVKEIIDPFLDRDTWTVSSIHKVAELAFRCLAFHGDMRPSMTEVADELEMIRGSEDDVTIASLSVASSSSSPYNRSKVAGVGSRRVVVPQMISNCLTKSKENNTSPDSLRDPWLSEQSSPSANSLLGNVIQ